MLNKKSAQYVTGLIQQYGRTCKQVGEAKTLLSSLPNDEDREEQLRQRTKKMHELFDVIKGVIGLYRGRRKSKEENHAG